MSASKPDNRPETFLKLVLQNPINRILVDRLPKLGLHDVWLVAGCLFQTVWNIKVGRPPAEGIRDYDIFYFNEDDLSWEAENEDIHRVAEQLRDLAISVELKNQARVHLWYSERFGPGYPQLRSSQDGIDRFLISCTRVGIHVDEAGALKLYAPGGLEEMYEGVLRPNPMNPRADLFAAKAESYRARWPWLRIEAQLMNP